MTQAYKELFPVAEDTEEIKDDDWWADLPSSKDAVQQSLIAVTDMMSYALGEFISGASAIADQKWIGDVFVSLTATRAETQTQMHTIWMIGRPSQGQYLQTTDDVAEAMSFLIEVLNG
jgi:hypothetical protein